MILYIYIYIYIFFFSRKTCLKCFLIDRTTVMQEIGFLGFVRNEMDAVSIMFLVGSKYICKSNVLSYYLKLSLFVLLKYFLIIPNFSLLFLIDIFLIMRNVQFLLLS